MKNSIFVFFTIKESCMFGFGSKLSQEEMDKLFMLSAFFTEILMKSEIGSKWSFNNLSFKLSLDTGATLENIQGAQQLLHERVDFYLQNTIKNWSTFRSIIQISENLADHIKAFENKVSNSTWDGNDEDYLEASTGFVAATLLYFSCRYEDALELIENRKEKGKYKKLIEKDIELLGVAITRAVNVIPIEYKKFFPRLSSHIVQI